MTITREEYLQLARALDTKRGEMRYTIPGVGKKQGVTWGDIWSAQADMIQDWVEERMRKEKA